MPQTACTPRVTPTDPGRLVNGFSPGDGTAYCLIALITQATANPLSTNAIETPRRAGSRSHGARTPAPSSEYAGTLTSGNQAEGNSRPRRSLTPSTPDVTCIQKAVES